MTANYLETPPKPMPSATQTPASPDNKFTSAGINIIIISSAQAQIRNADPSFILADPGPIQKI